jgi:hypothetical protein
LSALLPLLSKNGILVIEDISPEFEDLWRLTATVLAAQYFRRMMSSAFLTITDVSTGVAVVTDDFLSPTTTAALILAGTLLPDTAYDYELDFSDRLNGFNNGSGSFTTQGFDRRTDGSFTTGETPLPSTWFLMLSGIVGLGFVGFRGTKRNTAAALATA